MYTVWKDVKTVNFPTAADSPVGLTAELYESSSVKNTGLERPDSWWDGELSCFVGERTTGGRRG